MKARVVGTYQVVHDGKRYVEGDEFDAPEGDVQQWTTAGWVEQVRERKASAAEKSQSTDDAGSKAQQSASNKAVRSADNSK